MEASLSVRLCLGLSGEPEIVCDSGFLDAPELSVAVVGSMVAPISPE